MLQEPLGSPTLIFTHMYFQCLARADGDDAWSALFCTLNYLQLELPCISVYENKNKNIAGRIMVRSSKT